MELSAIGLHLPAMPPAGYSMLELRDAAKACGLRLSGVRLKDPARELDCPMIVFLKPRPLRSRPTCRTQWQVDPGNQRHRAYPPHG